MKTKQIVLGLIVSLLVGAGVILSGCVQEAVITPGVDWDVSCQGYDNATIVNNAARTITIWCDVNSTSHEMYYRGTDWLPFPSTELTFEVTPQGGSGTINITEGFITECYVVNPGIAIYSSVGSDTSLVVKNNQGLYSYNWNYGGIDKYERIQVTATSWFPTEIDLEIDWNEAGVSLIGAGSNKAINLKVAGEFWTIFLNVDNVWT